MVILTAVWHFSIVPALQIGVARQQAEVASRVADQIEQFIDERIRGLASAAQIGRLWETGIEAQKEVLYRFFKLDSQINDIRSYSGVRFG